MNKDRNLKSPRTTFSRHPERGIYEREQIHRILDEALYCHLGIVRDGDPVVLPTLHAREGDTVYIHGSVRSRLLMDARDSTVALTVSLMDGLVIARSAFHHSLNYRSVSLIGVAAEVTETEAKRAALDLLVERVIPGRVADCRPPTEEEMNATLVLAIPIEEAAAKVRSGPPVEAPGDEKLPHWGGVLPLRLEAGSPEPDEHTPADMETPGYLLDYARGKRK